jgi:PAS domain S-box-containing protein
MESLKHVSKFDEKARQLSLETLEILDTAPEGEFDEIAELASAICNTQSALITFVDRERTWFKARVGVSGTEAPRNESVCSDVILQNELIVIPDLARDQRYAKNQSVVSAPNFRFYAGLPIHSPDGQPVGALCVVDTEVKELSERQKSALATLANQVGRLLRLRNEVRELRQAELVLRFKETAVDHLHEGVVLQDHRGAVVDYNPAAMEVLGLSASELSGRTSLDPAWRAIREDGTEFPGDQHPAIIALATGQKQLNVVMGIYRANHELRWLKVSSVPLHFKNEQELSHVVTSFTDMTDLRKLGEDKQLYAEKLSEAARLSALGEVAGGIAHEINNPLAIIQGKAAQLEQRLKLTADSDQDRSDLKIIEKNVQRIAKIIKGLLTYARDGKQDPFREATFGQIVEDTLDLCRERFKKHRVTLDISYETHTAVECRQSQISQILLNLLNNAFDAVVNLPERWVKVQVLSDATSLRLLVQDSGSGIPLQISKKLAQPFFTTKAVGKGTGLGLSISRNLAELHNGTLEYDPSAAHTTFILTLPLRQTYRVTG